MWVRSGAFTSVEHLKGASLRLAPALLTSYKHYTRLERLDWVEDSNLLRELVKYGHKKLYNIVGILSIFNFRGDESYRSFLPFKIRSPLARVLNLAKLKESTRGHDTVYNDTQPNDTYTFTHSVMALKIITFSKTTIHTPHSALRNNITSVIKCSVANVIKLFTTIITSL